MGSGFLRRVFALIKKEFITTWKDPKSRSIIVFLPLMQLIIFANAATMEVKNIDMAVLDRDKSVESRELISRYESSPRFRHIYYMDTEVELQEKMDNQEVQIGMYINNDFSNSIKKQNPIEPATLLIIGDGRQTNSSAIATGYASQIIAEYSQEVTQRRGTAIDAIVRNWFNPNAEYQWYVLTIIVAMLSVVVTLILTALSVAREREMGTFDQLIVSPLSSFEILLGKTITPLVIAMGMACLMAAAVTGIFEVPFNGSFPMFMLSMFISLLSIVGVGLFISSIANTQQQAILYVMTFMMPSMLLSGFISPIEDMPEALQYFTYLNPIRFFMKLTRGIFLKGIGIEEVIVNLIPLILIAVLTLTLAAKTFKSKLE
ncbi:MAG: ABC transporter permease [Phascolarctobacterium sp.]|nr:ABC transporter permease [Phascolarctobacterium sp.]